MKCVFIKRVTKVLFPVLAFALASMHAAGQTTVQPAGGVALYRELLNPVLDPKDVYTIREVSILREDLHISISDGTIALMRDVNGHATGAVFDGDGEVLLVPPNRAERTSLALFTGSAVLEQRFRSAYFRFSDDQLAAELHAGLRGHAEDADEFVSRWQESARLLARGDALPILQAMTSTPETAPRFLHVRFGETAVGIFDVFFNTNASEQINVAQASVINNTAYFDTWTSFPMRSVRQAAGEEDPATHASLDMSDYRLHVRIEPPTDLAAETEFTLIPRQSGQRTVVLELSRYLKLTEVRMNGTPVEFIQNEAIDGSDLSRRGDDLIGVVLPRHLVKDQPVKLSFKYSGPVMFDAGGGLIYVGARGTWYPNVGPEFSNFNITFEYPDDWSIAATGRQVSSTVTNGRRTSRFVTDKPISRAGFNLGKFGAASSSAGNVAIRVYGGKTVEQYLAGAEARAGKKPDPSREAQQIADQASTTVDFLASQLDPFPYSNLEVAQLPGLLSQSWPGLIYLSSLTFLSPDERTAIGVHSAYLDLLLSRLMLSHETAHQWWGDAVDAVSYRDEWIVEALANYCALLMLEKNHPGDMKIALDYYREALLRDTPNGIMAEAGPVTLGARLASSKFPDAYERVLYGRGTWLIHMLRTMVRQAGGEKNDALFFSALKGLLASSPGHKISTLDLQHAFEQILPSTLTYEGKKSLDWFFDSWINGDSIPQFSLDKVHLGPAAGKIKVTGVVMEERAAKDMVTAVPIYAVDANGNSSFLAFVFADDAKTEFTLTAPAGTKQILLDPEETVLRREPQP